MKVLKKIAFYLAIGVLLSVFYTTSVLAAGTIKGKITCDNVNLRQNPGTSSSIITKLSEGTSVTVLGSSDNWYKVSVGSNTGWVCGDYIEITASVSVEILNLRSEPNTSSDIVDKLSKNTKVSILESSNDWYRVRTSEGKIGWVLGKYISTKIQTVSRGGNDSDISDDNSTAIGSTAQAIIAYGKRFLGVRYSYGSSSPDGFDCSGFTKYVFGHFGVNLERTAADQSSQGARVSYSALRAGDLVFFDTNGGHNHVNHAGIYIGSGMFIHASSDKGRVVISELVDGFYESAFMCARRII